LPAPEAYQVDSTGQEVSTGWAPSYSVSDSVVTFSGSGSYDTSKLLAIRLGRGNEHVNTNSTDWITYYGGSDADYPKDINVDNLGRMYVLSETWSANFPGVGLGTNSPGTDAVLGKFDNVGAEQWSFYWGGDSRDKPIEFVLDEQGQTTVVGKTSSSDIPLENALDGDQSSLLSLSDGFVFKVTEDGQNLIWSSYISGSSSQDDAVGVNIDKSGYTYIVGYTNSDITFPIVDNGNPNAYNQNTFSTDINGFGGSEAYILKFDPNYNQVWGSYFGGDMQDFFADVEIHEETGDVYILGGTRSTTSQGGSLPCNVPNQQGYFPDCDPGGAVYYSSHNSSLTGANQLDLILVQFTSTGELVWSTYLGGRHNDYAYDANIVRRMGEIVIDGNEIAVVALSTDGSTFSDHTTSGSTTPFQQISDDQGPLLFRFKNRELIWSSSFSCGQFEGIGTSYSVDLSGGNLYFSGQTRCDIPQMPIDYCTVPSLSSGFFPICPFSATAFFQDDDVEDGLALQAEHRGGSTDGFFAAFNSDNELIYSSYLGGNSADEITNIIVDGGFLYMVGETTSQFQFPVLDPETGAYFREDFIGGNLDGFIARIDIAGIPVSVGEVLVERDEYLHLYPNPTSGMIDVEFYPSNKMSTLVLSDLMGKKLMVFNPKEEKIRIDLSDYPDGVYLLQRLDSEGRVSSKKIIKQ